MEPDTINLRDLPVGKIDTTSHAIYGRIIVLVQGLVKKKPSSAELTTRGLHTLSPHRGVLSCFNIWSHLRHLVGSRWLSR